MAVARLTPSFDASTHGLSGDGVNAPLNHVIAWQLPAELYRDRDRARLASEVSAGQRSLGDSTSTARLTEHLADLTPRPRAGCGKRPLP
jgi:hypothetical protein